MSRSTTVAYDGRGALRQWSPEEAEGYAAKTNALYSEMVVDMIKPSQSDRVLDVGCGPGTISIPAARRVASVTALDYSEGMLAVLKRSAAEEGLNNIRCVNKFWREAEPGADIDEEYDIVVASNCINLIGALEKPAGGGRVSVEWDLEDAMRRLSRVGRRVCVSMPVTDFTAEDSAAFKSLGREYREAPTNIHVYNVAYQLGLRPSVRYFLRGRQGGAGVDGYLHSLDWMLGLSADERETARRNAEKIKAEIENSVHVWALLEWAGERAV